MERAQAANSVAIPESTLRAVPVVATEGIPFFKVDSFTTAPAASGGFAVAAVKAVAAVSMSRRRHIVTGATSHPLPRQVGSSNLTRAASSLVLAVGSSQQQLFHIFAAAIKRRALRNMHVPWTRRWTSLCACETMARRMTVGG